MRVVLPRLAQRNFHVFYFLLAGVDNTTRSKLFLTNPTEYSYLTCSEVPSIDDQDEFRAMEKAFTTLGFSSNELYDIYSILATILHLGNISFEQIGDNYNSSKISKKASGDLKKASKAFRLNHFDIEAALTSKTSAAGTTGKGQEVSFTQPDVRIHSAARALHLALSDIANPNIIVARSSSLQN